MGMDKKNYIGANLRSEYDMWLQDFIRVDGLLVILHNYFLQVHSNPKMFVNIVLVLNEFYSYLQSIITDRDRDPEVANFMKEAEKNLDSFMNEALRQTKLYNASLSSDNDSAYIFPQAYYKSLNQFRNQLMQIRQRAGMGIRVSRRSDPNERDENLLGIKTRQ